VFVRKFLKDERKFTAHYIFGIFCFSIFILKNISLCVYYQYLPFQKEKFALISFRSVADFKKHLLSAHKDAEKICIYDGCNWSCSKQTTYKEMLYVLH
jgi:hypothetical protein